MTLLISEFHSRVGGSLRFHIGKPLPEAGIGARRTDPRAMMDHLRERIYAPSPKPVTNGAYGLYPG
ncbi:MAG: hypothetical protein OEN23_09740 [Paracoccaceae bacterium]|nr:hypothetical protein [Paracoccaceae bacterium]